MRKCYVNGISRFTQSSSITLVKMSEKEYGTYGPAVDVENFFTNRVYYEDGIDAVSTREYSRYVSELMDRLGYSYEMIKHRQYMYNEYDSLRNRRENISATRVTTGGKGEGTTLFYESDIDFMFITDDVICADNPHHFVHHENVKLFQTERQDTSPGYTRLKLLRFVGSVFNEVIAQSLFTDETGSYYLSSQFFMDAMKPHYRQAELRAGITAEPTSGPSSPASNKYQSLDSVHCFRCFCPNIVERWISRPRSQGWPSPETVHEIARLDGHVVPVGFKGSQNMYREWRICYSLAELHLMRNLNEAQLKVYILLKKMCKSVLNKVCNDMTSYIMKNIVLWTCERNEVGRFTREMIMDRLLDCVQYLKKCVCENNLPSYMIPERNLLAGRLDTQQKQQLISVLNDLLQERGRMLLRCDKLRDAMIVMYKTPNMLKECSEKRDKTESLQLIKQMIAVETFRPGLSLEDLEQLLAQNELFRNLEMHMMQLMQFDQQELRQMGKTDDEIKDLWNKQLTQILS